MENRVMLLAEDNDDEVFLIKRSLNKSGVLMNMQVVHNGEETLAYLRAEGKYADRGQFPFPNFLLLDISMPRMNGLEVLEAIRNDPALTRLTVVFFTCSEHEDDILRASDLHANSYLLKPADLTNLDELLHLLQEYWICRNRRGPCSVECG